MDQHSLGSDQCLHLVRELVQLKSNTREYCAPGHRMGDGFELLLCHSSFASPSEPATSKVSDVVSSKEQSCGEMLTGYKEMVSAFRQIAYYDHSVSVPQLGSPFRFDPRSCLGMDQSDLAAIYNVKFVWPSTNGTTALNLLAYLAVLQPGDTVLCQRDSHASVFAPIIHLGLKPIYLVPRFSAALGINLGITPDQMRAALEKDTKSEIKAIFLTYPNYYGIATDIQACAQLAQSYGIPLIVDAAHGAYYHFHPALPMAAEDTSAAIVNQSLHKTCSALNQGSLCLFNSDPNSQIVQKFYDAVNQSGAISTSFSYITLVSVMLAVLQLKESGYQLLGQAIEMAEWTRQAVNQMPAFHSFGEEEVRQQGPFQLDPLRITIDVEPLGLSGYAVANHLIHNFQIYPEVATLKTLMFFLTLNDNWEICYRIVNALQTLTNEKGSGASLPNLEVPALPKKFMIPRKAFYAQKRGYISADNAIGYVSAETVAAYPPGNAVLVAGEEITQEIVHFLQMTYRNGGTLKGSTDPSFQMVQVVLEN